MGSSAVVTRPPATETFQKFYAKCVMEDWEEVTLIARATSEAEASGKIHSGYRVMMVMEIRTEEEQMAQRQKLRKSLMSTPAYH